MDKSREYYEGLDKRSKEYKEYKNQLRKTERLGLGDTIEDITEKTGIKKLVKAVFGEDCGCDKRKEILNKKFSSSVKAQRCLTEDQYKEYDKYYKTRTLNAWNDHPVIQMLIDVYAHVFAIQYRKSDLCIGCIGSARILKTISDRLDEVYLTYKQ